MASCDDTLIVKHLPAVLTPEERTELLQHFGAENVRCMSDNGRMKYTAFATFPDQDTAGWALKKLHQLDILGSKLSVEFSKANLEKQHPSLLEHRAKKKESKNAFEGDEQKEKEKKDMPALPESVNSLASKLNVNHPLNPKLKYLYPPPNVSILTNIANALATVPKFYVQVLHLMNKMNIPAPFGVVTATPPLAPEQPVSHPHRDEALGGDIVDEEEMVMSSSEESELESDSDEVRVKPVLPMKRQKKHDGRAKKKLKLQKLTSVPKGNVSLQLRPEDVFEPVDSQGNKKIEFKLESGISGALADQEFSGIEPKVLHRDILDVLEKEPTIGGFGKMEPARSGDARRESLSEGSEPEELSEFISATELRRNRLSEREMKEFSVFKKYDPGEPSSRLYIKNLHRHVTEKELKYIFGRYVDWSSEMEKNMFDVRLMTEGRMKGQAFVTLASEEVATRALKRTNGYLLHDKPMVVNFARSAKAKEPTETENAKNREDGHPVSRSAEKHPIQRDGKISSASEISRSAENSCRQGDTRSNATTASTSRSDNDEHRTDQTKRKFDSEVLDENLHSLVRSTSKGSSVKDCDGGTLNAKNGHNTRSTNSSTHGSDTTEVKSHPEVLHESPLLSQVPYCVPPLTIEKTVSAADHHAGNRSLPLPSSRRLATSRNVDSSNFEMTHAADDSAAVSSDDTSVTSNIDKNSAVHSLTTDAKAVSYACLNPAQSSTPPRVSDNDHCIPLGVSATPPRIEESSTPPRMQDISTPPRMEDSPTPPDAASNEQDSLVSESIVQDERFITFVMLQSNRLTEDEKLENKVFKNYRQGDPSCKLYVKNLNHKLVTEDDLAYIFGKFVQGCSDLMAGLNIKLLKEGRMKGQAFITYQTVSEAEKALEMVNGYVLYEKPMVVQFGKS